MEWSALVLVPIICHLFYQQWSTNKMKTTIYMNRLHIYYFCEQIANNNTKWSSWWNIFTIQNLVVYGVVTNQWKHYHTSVDIIFIHICGKADTKHRSQVIVLPIQKVSQTLLKANLRLFGILSVLVKQRPVTCDLCFVPAACGIIIDQSAHSIFAHCQVLLAADDKNKQLPASLCSQVQTLVF